MSKNITLHTFRRVALAEETMMRAMMPKAHAASPERLATYGFAHTTRRTARTLTLPVTGSFATLAEVAHA